VRAARPIARALRKLSFAPGDCAQADWSSFGAVRGGHTSRRLSFFVMGLCYSRLMDGECTLSQTMEHFLACHQHACERFGGVPHTSMVDNLTSDVWGRPLGTVTGLTQQSDI